LATRRFQFTRRFERMLNRLPKNVQEATFQKLERWVQNPSHLSLRIKRMGGYSGIWEMSVTMNYRITFEYADSNTISLRKIGTHDILRNP